MLAMILKRVRARLSRPSTGIVCALMTAALCGTGSILFKVFPNFYLRHLGGWWSAPRWHTAWAGALIVAVVVWGCHAMLSIRDSVSSRESPPVSSARRLGFTILQAGWVLALGVYLWLEVRPAEEKFQITAKGTDIHGETYRVLRIEARGRRPGSRRPVTAWLERRVGAASERLRVSRRQSWAAASGTYQLAMDRANVVNDSVIMRHGHRRVELSPSKPVLDGNDTIQLNAIRDPEPESSVTVPRADISIGDRRELLPLDPEWTGENAFLGFKESPVLVLRVWRNLGNSLAILALASLLLGASLLWSHARGTSRSPR
jgi:hypothetical protein